jgi:hypothetical protein
MNNKSAWLGMLTTILVFCASLVYVFRDSAQAGVLQNLPIIKDYALGIYNMIDCFVRNAAYIGAIGFTVCAILIIILIVQWTHRRVLRFLLTLWKVTVWVAIHVYRLLRRGIESIRNRNYPSAPRAEGQSEQAGPNPTENTETTGEGSTQSRKNAE